jgi:thiamine biosynthesis lipoprotein
MSGGFGKQLTKRQFLRITAVAGMSLAGGVGLTRALRRAADLREIRETRTQMGTLITVTVVHRDPARARQMLTHVFAEMERLENILSRHRAGTVISRLNTEGIVRGAPAEAVHVIRRALAYSALTGGAFDITVTPLLDLYVSSFAQTSGPPRPSQVRAALSLVGYQDIVANSGHISFKKPGMSVTLDGIAKGYIVDEAVRVLKEDGAEQVLVDAGGDMASMGHRSWGERWAVAIQNPRARSEYLAVLHLLGESVATSGDYLQSFTSDKSMHHILDPRTGRSPEQTSAVTVVAPTAMEADALSTALFVLGPREGLRLLDPMEGVEGMIVTKKQEVFRSRGLSRYLRP